MMEEDRKAVEQLKHEIRNALLGIVANRAKILVYLKKIVATLKDNDNHFKRIEEALKEYDRLKTKKEEVRS